MMDCFVVDCDIFVVVCGVCLGGDDVVESIVCVVWLVFVELGDMVVGVLIEVFGVVEVLILVFGMLVFWIGVVVGSEFVVCVFFEVCVWWCFCVRLGDVCDVFCCVCDVDVCLIFFGDECWLIVVDDFGLGCLSVFWVWGDLELLVCMLCVVIVGVWVVIGYGEYVVVEFVGDLVVMGVVIVFGGVYGIDGVVY